MLRNLRALCFMVIVIVVRSLPALAHSTDQQLTFVRDGDVIVLHVDTGVESVILQGEAFDPNTISWSPDGSLLAFGINVDQQEELRILNTQLNTGFGISLVPEGRIWVSLGEYRWSDNGRWIAYRLYSYDPVREQEMYELYVVEVEREALPQLVSQQGATSIKWLPGSLQFVYGGTGGYYRFDLTTGTQTPLTLPNHEYLNWSPDGSSYVIQSGLFIGETATLKMYDVETGDVREIASAYQIISQQFSPDGQGIGYEWDSRFWGERISVVNLETSQSVEVTAAEFGKLNAWMWSPDSSMILYTIQHERPDEQSLHIVNISTLENHHISDNVGFTLGWSPDSEWLHYQENEVLIVYNLADGASQEVTDFDRIIGWRP